MATSDIDFAALYSRHLDFVWRNLRALGVQTADLDDATQDTFVVAYRRRDDFRPDASMQAWLYGIAKRVAFRQRRGGGRRARLVEAVAAQPRGQPSLEAMVEDHQAWTMALAFLDGLPPAQREAYWLTEIEGLTAAEAGAALGVSSNTVSSRLRTARGALARHGDVMRARDAGELRRALRGCAGPSKDQRRRAAAALSVKLGALSKVAALGGLGPWLGAAAAAAAIAWGAGHLDAPDEVSREVPARPAAVVAPPSRSAEPTVEPTAKPMAAPSPEPRPRAVPSIQPRPSARPHTPRHADLLAEEAALVREIKTSVSSEPARALALVAQHGRRFPEGVLVHEASALRVQAACSLGRTAEALAVAEALPAAHAWASGCRRESSGEKPTNADQPGEEQGI